MAKKKQAKAAKKEAPAKKSGSMGWIIAAIVVVVIVAFLLLQNPAQAPAQKVTQPAAPAAEKGSLVSATAPPMDKTCTLAIGVVPGTKVVSGNNVAIAFKNNGRVDMEGSYFEFSDGAGKVLYKKNSDVVKAGAIITYKVDLGAISSEIGIAVKKYVIYPIQGGKACENQRNVMIDYT